MAVTFLDNNDKQELVERIEALEESSGGMSSDDSVEIPEIELDTTLTQAGVAADSKAVGDELNQMRKIEEVATVGFNLANPDNFTVGFLSDGNGTINEASTRYITTDFIEVELGETYAFGVYALPAGTIGTTRHAYLLYDANKQPISSSYVNLADMAGMTVTIEDTSAKYIRCTGNMNNQLFMVCKSNTVPSTFTEYEYSEEIKYTNIMYIPEEQIRGIHGNILYGKKWCVVGDSFTNEFVSSSPDEWFFSSGNFKGKSKVYANLIADRNSMELQWFAQGGRTLATPADGSFENAFSNVLYTQIDNDVDYITICLGINDGHHNTEIHGTDDGEDITGHISLGTSTDTDASTFYGAWNVVLPYIMENYPNAHIGIIVSNGLDALSYRTATIEMAKKYGIPYIDLNGDERTQAMHRAQNTDLPESVKQILLNKYAISMDSETKNTHPNNIAHDIEATIIENFLRSI